jgi:YesN/AraC family two-component response regulator
MYRLVLIDDNERERDGIARLPLWSELGLEVSGKFENGSAALDYIRKNPVDLVLSDISMPVMNGLELADALRTENPNIRIVFMSGHSDFEYARTALHLDVEDYLLKPFTDGELRAAMSKITARLEQERHALHERQNMRALVKQSMPALTEQFYRELLLGEIPTRAEALARADFLELEMNRYSAFAVAYYKVSERQNGEEKQRGAGSSMDDGYADAHMIRKLIEEESGSRCLRLVSMALQHFACIYGRPGHESDAEFAQTLMRTATGVLETVENLLPAEVSVGLSNTAGDFYALPELFRQARVSLENSFFEMGSRIVSYTEIEDILGGRKSHEQAIVDSIKQVVAQRYADQISVGEILSGIYISAGHANHIFKKHTGMTIFDWLTAYRMERAKGLLRNPTSKVYLVSEQVGYTNSAHFRIVFKKHAGVTPGEYKDRPF